MGLRVAVVRAVRGSMETQGLRGDQIFLQACEQKPAFGLRREQFVAFVKSVAGSCPVETMPVSRRREAQDTSRLTVLFDHVTQGSEALKMDRFVAFMTQL